MFKNIQKLFILSALVAFAACSNDDNSTPTFSGEVQTATDIQAGTDATGFTFYNLRTGNVVDAADSASSNWDIAFKDAGFEIFILTNNGISGPGEGGAVVVDLEFDTITEAPNDDQFNVDAEGALAINPNPGASWWVYTATQQEPNHAVLPKDPHTIFVRTANGSYAKVEIMNYYQGNPDTSTPEFASLMTRPASGYFTFKYELIEE